MTSNSAASPAHPQVRGVAPGFVASRQSSAREVSILVCVALAGSVFASALVAFNAYVGLASLPPASAVPALFEPMQEEGFAVCIVAGVCR